MTREQYSTAYSYAIKFATKYWVEGIEWIELVHAGMIGAIEALENFDPEQSSWATHSYFRIKGNIIDHIRKVRGATHDNRPNRKNTFYKNLDHLDKPIGEDEDMTLYRVVKSDRFPDSTHERMVLEDFDSYLTNVCSDRDENIIRLRFYEGEKLKTIGKKVDMTFGGVAYICRKHVKAFTDSYSDALL
jgi:RNA polymerase sigma factor (sigma-70 family)